MRACGAAGAHPIAPRRAPPSSELYRCGGLWCIRLVTEFASRKRMPDGGASTLPKDSGCTTHPNVGREEAFLIWRVRAS
jgi:hypothetical protein